MGRVDIVEGMGVLKRAGIGAERSGVLEGVECWKVIRLLKEG